MNNNLKKLEYDKILEKVSHFCKTYLGKKYGSQANILKNVTAYWYIDSYTISGSNPTPIPTPAIILPIFLLIFFIFLLSFKYFIY